MDGVSAGHTFAAVNTLELARLQFGITTVFHFIFVPMSIGLAAWVGVLPNPPSPLGR